MLPWLYMRPLFLQETNYDCFTFEVDEESAEKYQFYPEYSKYTFDEKISAYLRYVGLVLEPFPVFRDFLK